MCDVSGELSWENREQGAGNNREQQGTPGNRREQQGTGNREQGTNSVGSGEVSEIVPKVSCSDSR